MGNVEVFDKSFQELHDLLKESFPELECLRCGHDTMYLMPNAAGLPGLPAITIVCARCGHIEMFHREVLRSASKPIPIEKKSHEVLAPLTESGASVPKDDGNG
jgi:predicted nucleic-acid-binding Zn-ribbon protein